MELKTTQYLNKLCRTCEEISCTLSLEEALDSIVRSARTGISAKAASIRLLDERGENLRIMAAEGLSKKYLEKGPVKLTQSPIDREALSGRAVAILDATRDKKFQYPQEAKREGIKSVLCVPLKAKTRPLGVLRVYTSRIHQFTKEEIDYLFTLASQGGVVIRNAQLYSKLRALYEVGKLITSSLDLPRVLDLIVKNAAAAMGVKGASILLLDRKKKTLEVSATYGLSETYLKKGPISADKSITDCLRGRVVSITDVLRDKRIQYPRAALKEGISSLLCVPLRLKDEIIGVLRIYAAKQEKFLRDEIEFLSVLADFGAVAIENATLYRKIKVDYDDLVKEVWRWYDWGNQPPEA
jgi:signal transduction protein with GAF and PtsI domain